MYCSLASCMLRVSIEACASRIWRAILRERGREEREEEWRKKEEEGRRERGREEREEEGER